MKLPYGQWCSTPTSEHSSMPVPRCAGASFHDPSVPVLPINACAPHQCLCPPVQVFPVMDPQSCVILSGLATVDQRAVSVARGRVGRVKGEGQGWGVWRVKGGVRGENQGWAEGSGGAGCRWVCLISVDPSDCRKPLFGCHC